MIWSNIVDTSNTPDSLEAIYRAPQSLTRDDPRIAAAMADIRKATTNPNPQPVATEAIPAVKSLLARLYSASGQTTLSGQVTRTRHRATQPRPFRHSQASDQVYTE